MHYPLALLLLVVLILPASACRRRSQTAAPSSPPAEKSTATPTAPTDAAAPVASSPAPAPNNAPAVEVDRLPTAPPGSSRTLPVNLPLTEALQRHMEATGKFPADFNALVTGKYLPSLPQPPAGKRFAVDRANLQVVLMGQ